jgi:hypothetical protein
MAPASRLGRQIEEVLAALGRIGASTALIGGLALAPYRVVRATMDVDLLADGQFAEAIEAELRGLGYECLHRSPDSATFLRGDERVDFLFAHRPMAKALLAAAVEHSTPFGVIRVVSLEGLVAFKLQGLVNDPRRTQDLEDIRALLRANGDRISRDQLREYLGYSARRTCLNSSLPNEAREAQPLAYMRATARSVECQRSRTGAADPFTALDDLMVVVEALCPRWPSRPATTQTDGCRL